MIDFLNQIETLLLDMLKFQAFPGIFLSTQTQVFQLFFCLTCQIQGFPR